jgi:hypothetical protein
MKLAGRNVQRADDYLIGRYRPRYGMANVPLTALASCDRERNLIGEDANGRTGSRGEEREHTPRMPSPNAIRSSGRTGPRHGRFPPPQASARR